MSKAFTNEDAGVPEPPLRPLAAPKPGARPFTQEGLDALRSRAEALRSDLGAAAPPDQRARLDALEGLIAAAVVVDAPADTAHISFGAWVDLEDEEGRRARYRIVGADEADPKSGRLSFESPLARALLGKAEGDEVHVELPKGTRTFQVMQVRFG
jgi:transcription elongation factor GreB